MPKRKRAKESSDQLVSRVRKVGPTAEGPIFFGSSTRTVCREARLTVHHLGPDLVGVSQLLEEASVLGHSSHSERLVITSDGVDEVVVRDSLLADGSDNVRGVC